MNYKGKKVLLLDGFGRQIPSLMKQLHDLGCVITTMNASKLDVGCSSRYPKKKIVVPGIREDVSAYRDAIYKELEADHYDILFPVIEKSTDICTDGVIEAKYPELKIVAAPRDAFLKAYNKQLTMCACMDNGVACPVTKRDEESLEDYLNKISFPLAAKPRKGSGGAGFKKIHDRAELDKYLSDGTIKLDEYVLQEFIPQTEHMFNCYVMMDDNHEPVFAVPLETCRWFPIDGGAGCFGRTVDMPIIQQNAIKLLKALEWSGFGQVSFMMDPRDHTPKVGEINGRISAGVKIVDYAGCKPVKHLLDRLYGQPLERVEKIPVGLGLRYFHTDIMWLIKSPNRFSAKPSWFDFRKSKDYIFSWADPIPFFSYAIEHVLTYREDMAHRKH